MDAMTAAGITARKITRTRSARAWAAAPAIHDGMFRVMTTLHPDCDQCLVEADRAAVMAGVTGSRGATHRRTVGETLEHAANVRRDPTWVHPRVREANQRSAWTQNPAPMVRIPGLDILVPGVDA